MNCPGDLPGSVVYRRVFKQPTGLDTWERVSLEVDRAIFSGEISLNGQSIGSMQAGQFFSADITQLLQPNNELHVKVDLQSRQPISTQPTLTASCRHHIPPISSIPTNLWEVQSATFACSSAPCIPRRDDQG